MNGDFDIQVKLTDEQAKDIQEFIDNLIPNNRVFAEFTDGHVEDITDNPRYAYIVDHVLKKDIPQIKHVNVINKIF